MSPYSAPGQPRGSLAAIERGSTGASVGDWAD